MRLNESANLGWISWYSSKLFEPKLRIVKSCQGEQTVQITTSWNTLFLKVRFKFYRIHNVEIGSNFVICHSSQLTVLQQWTCFHRISYVSYLRLQISPHNSIQYEIVWELRLVHDPQQFASTWKILMKCGLVHPFIFMQMPLHFVSQKVLVITFNHSKNRF